MRLRRTPARAAAEEKDEDRTPAVSITSREDDSDNDVLFGEVEPFSPVCSAADINDCSDKHESTTTLSSTVGQKRKLNELGDSFTANPHKIKIRLSSDSKTDGDNESSDKEWTAADSKSSTRRKVKKVCNSTVTYGRRLQKFSVNAGEHASESDVELEQFVSKEQVSEVKKILEEFPEQFIKEYCNYLHDVHNKDAAPTAKKTLKRKQYAAHSRQRQYKNSPICVICSKEFETHEMVVDHLMTHGSSKGFLCICEKTFRTFKDFVIHISWSHSSAVYKCPYCDKNFYGYSHLKVHWKRDHALAYPYVCILCKKGFKKEWRFLEHINVHTGLRPHKCGHCDKAYGSSESLKEHIRINHNKQLKCHLCDKVFGTLKLLKLHSISHGDERKHKCDKCNKSFKNVQALNHHKSYYHDPKITFKCDNCSKSFRIRSSWNRHCKSSKHGSYSEIRSDSPKNDKTDHFSVRSETESNFVMEDEFLALNKQPLQLDKCPFTNADIEYSSDDEGKEKLFVAL